MPSVSVVLPTYNRASLVGEAVESVLCQTYGDLELLVVLDGETDDTYERLQRFRDPRLRLIRQQNAGLSAARNTALAAAGGEYIALLDDDDVWLPRKLECQIAALKAYPDAAFIYSEFYAWRPGESLTRGGLRRWFDKGWFSLAEEDRPLLDADGVDPGPELARVLGGARLWKGNIFSVLMATPLVLPSTAVFRRSAMATETGFPVDDNYCGDWAFFAELGHDSDALFLDTETVLNRSHSDPGRLTRAPQANKLSKQLSMLRAIWGSDKAFLASHGRRYQAEERSLLVQLSKAHLREGHAVAARRALNEAWRLPGRADARQLVLGGVLAVPGLPQAVWTVLRPDDDN